MADNRDDNKVEIEIDLPIKVCNYIDEEALRLNITADEFVEIVLKEYLDEHDTEDSDK